MVSRALILLAALVAVTDATSCGDSADEICVNNKGAYVSSTPLWDGDIQHAPRSGDEIQYLHGYWIDQHLFQRLRRISGCTDPVPWHGCDSQRRSRCVTPLFVVLCLVCTR